MNKMVVRAWTIGVVLMLAISALLYRNLSKGAEVIAEIDSLMAKGKDELEPCRVFKKNMEKIEGKNFNFDSPSHANKYEALAILELLRKYPGTAPSFHRATQLFNENHDIISSRIDQFHQLKKRIQFQSECAPFSFFAQSQLLVKDIKALDFTQAEAASVFSMMRGYLKAELPSNSLFVILLKGNLLKTYISASELPNREQLLAKATVFEKQGDQARKEINDFWSNAPYWKHVLISSQVSEIKSIKELNRAYSELLQETKI